MEGFIQKYNKDVIGVLNGWDRLMIRGTLRTLAVTSGMMSYLFYVGVLLKNIGEFVEDATMRVKLASLAVAERLNRPVVYLNSTRIRKEERARQIAQTDGITEGLICVLTCVEPCRSYSIRRDRASKKLILEPTLRKCLHVYHYWMDRDFGLMHGRLQTWFPFSIQVCLNGRSWLALFRAISCGEHIVNGFRNRDLVVLLHGIPSDPIQRKRLANQIGHRLRLLRAHRIIRKVPRTHRYQLTRKGRQIVTAILQAQGTTVAKLTRQAA